MLIGLDFDGVVSDAGKLKSDGAKRLYDVEIAPEKFKTEIVVGQGILTLEQYRKLQKDIYGTRELGLLMEPVKDAFHYIDVLQKQGHRVRIVTSRGKLESEIAEEWMKKHNQKIHLTGIGGGVSKAEACKGMDVYVDDDLDKLEPLVGVVPNRFLFSWGYNNHIKVSKSVAKRVGSWSDLYFEITNIDLDQRLTEMVRDAQ